VPSSSIAAANKEVKQGSCTLPTFLLARQNFSNGSLPNLPVDVVATNDGLYSVGAHQADYYDLMLVLYLHASWIQLMIVGVAISGLPRRLFACSVYGYTMDNIIIVSFRWTGNVQLLYAIYVHHRHPRYEEVTSRLRARNAQCMRCARANQREFYWYAAEMATGGYASSSAASSGGDNASDDNCSEASSNYTSSSSDNECDDGTGCKTFTLVLKVL
jgi:hypothetical protein